MRKVILCGLVATVLAFGVVRAFADCGACGADKAKDKAACGHNHEKKSCDASACKDGCCAKGPDACCAEDAATCCEKKAEGKCCAGKSSCGAEKKSEPAPAPAVEEAKE